MPEHTRITIFTDEAGFHIEEGFEAGHLAFYLADEKDVEHPILVAVLDVRQAQGLATSLSQWVAKQQNICYRCKQGEHGEKCASDYCTCCGDPLKNGKYKGTIKYGQ